MLPSFPLDSPLAIFLKQGLLGTRDIMMKAGDYEQQAMGGGGRRAFKQTCDTATKQQSRLDRQI